MRYEIHSLVVEQDETIGHPVKHGLQTLIFKRPHPGPQGVGDGGYTQVLALADCYAPIESNALML
jgi:hypothetical protein